MSMPRVRNGKPEEPSPPKKRRTTTRPPKDAAPQEPEADAPADAGDGKPKKKLTMFERLRVAERIVTAREKQKADTWAVISKREGIPVRTLQAILAQYRDDARRLGDNTGVSILSETLLLYTASIEKLAYEAEHGETSAARVGAVRSMLDALKGRIELLAVMGRMPRSFRAMDELAALQRLVRRLAEVVERHNLPPEVVEEFVVLAREIQPVIEGRAAELPRAS